MQKHAERVATTTDFLQVEDMVVQFPSPHGILRAVDGVTFHLARGETLAVVGESGSGKSVTCLSLTKLLPSPPTQYVRGSVQLAGRDLWRLSERELRRVRGKEVALIFQNARAALHPDYTLEEQLTEVLKVQRAVNRPQAAAAIAEVLQHVNMPDPVRVLQRYPHEVGGGVCQRITIAMAILSQPKVLLADEPTTALDVISQLEVLNLLRRVQGEINCGMILVSHDLAVVRSLADRVAVMYAGRIVETGATQSIFDSPQHPYTQALLRCSFHAQTVGERLYELPGRPPDLSDLPPGCSFAPRCRSAFDRCWQAPPPPYVLKDPSRTARCYLYAEEPCVVDSVG